MSDSGDFDAAQEYVSFSIMASAQMMVIGLKEIRLFFLYVLHYSV